ncbi:putative NAD-dependent histone deacetylase [Cladorrhinum samala]|uniref:NAD-dependent histone deacetylase n=1 Tax=Cladorrhinum samala TaxID=585594 RepID=A0AAV9HHK2_9PEZI|nr:putative NAD-dependent histone deacetylase [Cladorrhinum samala]
MPTIHVEPGSEALLQDIANALLKARKVVVITGAGISTNSGIPDFRSENGLYSLIQAQFDAAAKRATDGNPDTDASEVSDERPTKKRRLSQEGLESKRSEGPGQETGESVKVEGDGSTPLDNNAESSNEARNVPSKLPNSHNMVDSSRDAAAQNGSGPKSPSPSVHEDALPVAPSLTPLPSPRFPSTGRAQTETRTTLDLKPHFASSPPTHAMDALRLRTRPDLMDHHARSSSPLSSPPPISFDPYQESSDTPSSDSSSGESASSRSASEGPSSASTPLLTSQTSSGSWSSRTTLPNMKGRDLFDAQIWSCPIKTSVFYTFATTLRQKVRDAEPTNSHRFVSVLRDSRKLVRCYTQNIDQLEERVGLTTSLSLGAGNRYRFSTKSGRNPGGRSSLKSREVSDLSASQGANDDDSQRENNTPSDPLPASSQDDVPNSQTDPLSEKPNGSALESGSGTGASQNDAPATSAPAPPAPNRGVECVFLHGSLAELRCFVCARTAPWDDEYRQAETLAGRQPTCPHCAGATAAREERGKRALGVGKLRPDIVLYGEDHPNSHLVSTLVQHDLSLQPDMLLILGTSMRVHGLKVLVREFAKAVHDRGGKVVFVNFTKPPESVWADVIDMWVQWDCDAWVDDLQRRKPALWLPPGTALPEELKPPKAPKVPKVSKRQSGGETGKRKDGADATSQKKRDGDGPARKAKRESTGATIVVQSVQEVVKEIPRLRPLDPLPREAPLQVQGPLPKEGLFMPPIPLSSSSSASARPTPSTKELTPPAAPTCEGDVQLPAVPAPSELPVATPTPTNEMPPPPLPTSSPLTSKPLVSRPARTAREPKLNPDAKRPASIRDHKLNGAYLTCKILQELKRITGESPTESAPASPVPAAPRPKTKKGRKSAPGVLETENPMDAEESSRDGNDVKMVDAPPQTKRRRKAKAAPSSDETPPAPTSQGPEATVIEPIQPPQPQEDSSISAMVKTRKRKRTVAWRMIRGVETQVTLDENGDIILPAPPPAPTPSQRPQQLQRFLPHTQATFGPALPSPSFRTLPEPVPSPLASPKGPYSRNNSFAAIDDAFRETDKLIAISRNNHSFPSTPSTNHLLLDNAFHETDRLIAKFQQESRPSTPVLHLAPLNIPAKTQAAAPHHNSPPKLEPLEPKVHSPGPRAEISSNVGSPISSRMNNPFFLSDPLAGHFGYCPPMWAPQPFQGGVVQFPSHAPTPLPPAPPPPPHHHHHHHLVQQGQVQDPQPRSESTGSNNSTRSAASWCPDEQLRKEQEVAMMLSVMRGASMLSPAP